VFSRRLSASPVLSRVARRFGWGLADQAMSSVSNAAVSFYVARELGATQFGAFSLAYVSLSAGTGALILFGAVQVTMLVAAIRSGEPGAAGRASCFAARSRSQRPAL